MHTPETRGPGSQSWQGLQVPHTSEHEKVKWGPMATWVTLYEPEETSSWGGTSRSLECADERGGSPDRPEGALTIN